MDKVHTMSVFVKVVEMGSFTAVANHLDTTVGNISRAVSVLEDNLNTRLLQRSTRRLVVTDAGRRFYERSVAILSDIERAEAEARDALLEPRGLLRVHAVPGLGRQLVSQAVLAYRSAYPEVSVDLMLSQRMPNLLEEQLDVAIVIARTLPDSAYVSQKIGNQSLHSRGVARLSGTASGSRVCGRPRRSHMCASEHGRLRAGRMASARQSRRGGVSSNGIALQCE